MRVTSGQTQREMVALKGLVTSATNPKRVFKNDLLSLLAAYRSWINVSRPLRSSSARIGLRSRQPGFFTDFRRPIGSFLGSWTGLVQETEVRRFLFAWFQYNESCMSVKDMIFRHACLCVPFQGSPIVEAWMVCLLHSWFNIPALRKMRLN